MHDRQPIVGGGGRYLLVADIRLDNRSELMERLGVSGSEGHSLADSALLMLCFERWHEQVLDFIVGDYAFAVWDAAEDRLFLARDPFGERPLFFHRGRDFFAFASMPKGLHALPQVPRRPNEAKLAEFVALVPDLDEATHYAGVSKILPGHALRVTRDQLVQWRYWRPQSRDLGLKDFREYREAFRAELDRAVRSRLRGVDQKVASHLSGGWDSSAVTSTAAMLRLPANGSVIAFTSVPSRASRSVAPFGRIADEGGIAAEAAALHANIEHVLVEGSDHSPIASLDRYVETYDRPLHNLCNFLWMGEIQRLASARGASVLLTGELGNLNISAAPYRLLADLIRQRRLRDWWRESRALLAARKARVRVIAANSFGPWVPQLIMERAQKLSSQPHNLLNAAVHPHMKRAIEKRRAHLKGRKKPGDQLEAAIQVIAGYDFGNYRKGALANWGIDERDPTADRRLMEFCLSLPTEMLLKDGVRRPLARAALSDRLPPAVLDERRKGYQAADWHEGMTKDLGSIAKLVEEIAANATASSILDVDAMRTWIREWPSSGWENPRVMTQYRLVLLSALSAGHFILSTTR
jgi:asparagine synthase (glutamine-hydrolysing)